MELKDSSMCSHSDMFANWIVLSENQTVEAAMVGNWLHGKTVVYGSVLSLWTVLVNSALCILFMLIRRTGTGRRNFLVNRQMSLLGFSFSFVQLLIGAIVIPGSLATESSNAWQFGWVPCRIWLTLKVILIAVTFWLLAAMTLNCLLNRLSLFRQPQGMTSTILTMVLVWMLSGIPAVPLLISFATDDLVLEEVCAIGMSPDDAIIITVTSFLVPVSFILIGSTVLLVMMTMFGDEVSPMSPNDVEATFSGASKTEVASTFRKHRDASRTVLSINIIAIVAWSPAFFVTTLVPFCHGMCIDPGLWTLFLWVGYTYSGVAPCLWVADPQLRNCVCLLVKSLIRSGRFLVNPEVKVKVKHQSALSVDVRLSEFPLTAGDVTELK